MFKNRPTPPMYFCCSGKFETQREYEKHLQTKHHAKPSEIICHLVTCGGNPSTRKRRRFCKQRPVVFVYWLALCARHWNLIPLAQRRKYEKVKP